jgi:hypothetical protein
LHGCKFPHQLRFGSALGEHPYELFTSFRLTGEGKGVRIKANFNISTSELIPAVVLLAFQANHPIAADAVEPPPLLEIRPYMLKTKPVLFPLRPIYAPRVTGLPIGFQRGFMREHPPGHALVEDLSMFIETGPHRKPTFDV